MPANVPPYRLPVPHCRDWHVVCGSCKQRPAWPLSDRNCPTCGQMFAPLCVQEHPVPWTPREALQLARMAFPELTPLIGSLTVRVHPGVETMCVTKDGLMVVGEQLLSGTRWNVRQAAGVILHEALHLLKRHYQRAVQQGVKPAEGQEVPARQRLNQALLNQAWNLGGDADINGTLLKLLSGSLHAQIPPDGVYPVSLGLPDGKSTEAYFVQALELLREMAQERARTVIQQQLLVQTGGSQDSSQDEDEDVLGSGENAELNDEGQDEQDQDWDFDAWDPDGNDPDDPEDEEDGDDPQPGEQEQPGEQGQPGKSTRPSFENPYPADPLDELNEDQLETIRAELIQVLPGSGAADGIRRDWEPEPLPLNLDSPVPGLHQTRHSVMDSLARKAVQQVMTSGRGCMGEAQQLLGVADARETRLCGKHKLRAVLRRACWDVQAGRDRRTYCRSSRYSQPDCPLPVTRSVTPRVTLIIDTSGSMEFQSRLSIAISCVEIVTSLYTNHQGIRVITGDTEGKSDTLNVKRAAEILRRLVGGGGTDMAAIMRQAVSTRPAPQLLIVASDCDSPWPLEKQMQGVPVVIVACDAWKSDLDRIPTWASVITITEAEWASRSDI